MTPMTTPERTYCDSKVRSMAVGPSALWRHHQVAGLELRREDDLHVGKRLLRLGVLGKQDGGTPLLPVGTLAAREADGPVPPFERVGQQGFDEVCALGALGRVEGVCEQDHLGISIKGPVYRFFLELLLIRLTERLAPSSELHSRVVVHNVSQIVPLVTKVLPVLGPHWQVIRDQHGHCWEEANIVGLLDDQVGWRTYAPVQHDIRVPVLDLEQLWSEVDDRAVEDNRLQLSLDLHGLKLLFGLLNEAHTIISILSKQSDALEAVLLDPAVPELHPVRVNDVGPKGVVEVLLGNATGRRLG